MVEKFYINGVPVYRRVKDLQYEYRLFEDSLDRCVVYASSNASFKQQCEWVLNTIKTMFKDADLRCVEQISDISIIKYDSNQN